MHTSVSGVVIKKCGVSVKSDSNFLKDECRRQPRGQLPLFFLRLPSTLTVSGGIDI